MQPGEPSPAALSATATFNALVLPDTPAGTITNTAAATTTASEGTTANNEDTETTTVVTSSDVGLTKSNSPNPVPTGTNLQLLDPGCDPRALGRAERIAD